MSVMVPAVWIEQTTYRLQGGLSGNGRQRQQTPETPLKS